MGLVLEEKRRAKQLVFVLLRERELIGGGRRIEKNGPLLRRGLVVNDLGLAVELGSGLRLLCCFRHGVEAVVELHGGRQRIVWTAVQEFSRPREVVGGMRRVVGLHRYGRIASGEAEAVLVRSLEIAAVPSFPVGAEAPSCPNAKVGAVGMRPEEVVLRIERRAGEIVNRKLAVFLFPISHIGYRRRRPKTRGKNIKPLIQRSHLRRVRQGPTPART